MTEPTSNSEMGHSLRTSDGETAEPTNRDAAGVEAEPGLRKVVTGRTLLSKTDCKNLSPREILNSEMSRCKVTETFKPKQHFF